MSLSHIHYQTVSALNPDGSHIVGNALLAITDRSEEEVVFGPNSGSNPPADHNSKCGVVGITDDAEPAATGEEVISGTINPY